ncbi:MAG: pseudouridylate synthase [Bacteroidales bacterium]|nr:pseudouridylate synthase [Bacteroidales bacterium]
MFPTPALPFIPQRPPMVMVDNLLSCDPITVRTDFRIPTDCIFLRDELLSESGLMENIAQTCAARIGWLNQDKPVRIGVIGSINHFEVFRRPAADEVLQTTVTVANEVFEAIIVHAEIRQEEEMIAQCDMKVFVIGN